MDRQPLITVIVPVFNESENVASLLAEIVAATAKVPIREIIYVNDGSTDDTLRCLQEHLDSVPALRIIHHDRRLGQSAAFPSGASAAKQELLVFLDGDLQNDPADIVMLYARYQAKDPAKRLAVLGQRAIRQDRFVRQLSSRLANRLRASILKDGTRDTGCSLKLIRRSDFLALPYFDHMHRFLPALFQRAGARVVSVPVNHRPRQRGESKYGLFDRLRVGIVDIFGVMWLTRRFKPGLAVREE